MSTHIGKSLSTAVVAAATLFTATTAAAVELGQETSDRTPAKETQVPLTQVDTVDGETSDRTPGTSSASSTAVPETSDRTPSKKTPTPAAQADKFRDETSDRTPGNH